METYEAMMDNPLPVPTGGQSSMASYQVPASFPQFPDNETLSNTYGNLSGMASSYPSTPTTPGNPMNMGGYNTPSSQQSGYGNLSSSSSSSFSMPYDPPSMPGGPSLSMPTPPPPQSNKTIYSCTYCGLVLSSNNALIEHKRIHTGERPFACHICNKRFTQKAHLNIHKRIHTGEKPYACHICHKRFAQSSHLSSHKRIHTGEKPFVCGICHIGFTQKQRLDAHLKKHMERPGQDISPGQNRHSHMMSPSTRMDAFNQGPMRDDPHNFMHMVGQGMPYIKQESGVTDIHSNNALRPNLDLSVPKDDDKPGSEMARLGMNRDMGNNSSANEIEEREAGRMQTTENGNGNEESRSDASKAPKIATPSFSSEGMFLHPSGYVAYGGIEDSEESQDNNLQENEAEATESSHQQQGGTVTSGGHRRKPSVVRKRYSESPGKENDAVKSLSEEPCDAVNGLHKFHALNQNLDQNTTTKEDDGVTDENDTEDFKDTGEVLDDKNDPPYHGSGHAKNGGHGTGVRRLSSQSGQVSIETRSHSRRINPNHADTPNAERMNTGPGSLSYTGPGNSHANPGLVKINNRISLVNFTADELINHLMKRDDVHRCQFCCLIFQDAAMYHIHRNMHDKQDIRRCNMCGKLLLDKYDFTAHFLSMHQN